MQGAERWGDFEFGEVLELFGGDGRIGVAEGIFRELRGGEEGGEVREGDGLFFEEGEGVFREGGFGIPEDGVERAVLFRSGAGLEGVDQLSGEDGGGLGGDLRGREVLGFGDEIGEGTGVAGGGR